MAAKGAASGVWVIYFYFLFFHAVKRLKGFSYRLCVEKVWLWSCALENRWLSQLFQLAGFERYSPSKSGTRRHVSKACFFLRHETCLNFIFHLRMISQALQVFLLPSCTVWSCLLCQDPSFNPAVVVPRDFSLPGRLWHAGEKLCLAEVLSSFLASTAYCTQRHREGEISLCLCSDSAFLQTMLLLVYVSLLKDSLHSI